MPTSKISRLIFILFRGQSLNHSYKMFLFLKNHQGWLMELYPPHYITNTLFGIYGDQLSVAQIRNTQGILHQTSNALSRSSYLIALPGFFHPQIALLDVYLFRQRLILFPLTLITLNSLKDLLQSISWKRRFMYICRCFQDSPQKEIFQEGIQQFCEFG